MLEISSVLYARTQADIHMPPAAKDKNRRIVTKSSIVQPKMKQTLKGK